jgi:hypothetical protein
VAVVAKSVFLPAGPQAVVTDLAVNQSEEVSNVFLQAIGALSKNVRDRWHYQHKEQQGKEKTETEQEK